MSNRSVLVSYAFTQSTTSESWTQFHAALLAQLPLRNMHWKSASRPAIRTIQELDVSLIPLETQRDEHTSQIPVTFLEKPLLNIYVVTCEDMDLDAYRVSIKKQIKDWHAVVSARKHQEWLIIHIVKPAARPQTGNFFQLKGTVLDKIKADFNTDKRDRCIQLVWSKGYDNPSAWAEVITKFKDGLLSAFDSAVAQREDDVRRSESQRQMPGWNFCTFFILKESLASSFEGVHLFEDALLQYDELEVSFNQVSKDKNLSWFGNLISPSSKDDSLPLLSVTKKPYRDFILANTISVFDFRIYLLARQCALLCSLGRINEISQKAGTFLSSFGGRLREIEQSIPAFFIESWIYSSALSVVEQCDTWASKLTMEGLSLALFNAGKGELLELARNQLDVIGIRVGHLPSKIPFSLALPRRSPTNANEASRHTSKKISKSEILASIDDSNVFCDLYVKITNRAIDTYAKAGRRKFALKLHGSLAALDVHRERLSAALTTYTSLPAHYAPHMWTSLEAFMLSRALDTHEDLKRDKDRDWIHLLLSFLKTCILHTGVELLMHEDDRDTYISKLVDTLKNVANELDSNLAYPDHPALTIRVSSEAKLAETQDGSYLDVTITNHLPCSLPVDEVNVTLVGRDSEKFRFLAATQSLKPGASTITLFCPTISVGTYVLDSNEVRMSKLQFQWTHRKASSSGRISRTSRHRTVLVRVPRDIHALDVRLRQPNRIELGKPAKLLVIVSPGRNDISGTRIRLTSPGVTFQYADAVIEGNEKETSPGNLEVSQEGLGLSDVPSGSHRSLLVPYSGSSTLHVMKVDIEVEYVTASESASRTIRLHRVVATTLPVTVNVEDFFRGTRLLSKFTISTTSHQHVRIASAQLDGAGEDGVKITGCQPRKREIVTVTPTQSANFLFYLDPGKIRMHESLNLHIHYRMLRDEVEYLIRNSVETILADSPAVSLRDDIIAQLVETLEQDARWVEMYEITGQLNVPGGDEDNSEIDKVVQKVKKVLKENKHSYPWKGEWREIQIPVDVPQMSIVAAARLQILSTPFTTPSPAGQAPTLYAGQPISAVLTVKTSFHWSSSTNDDDRTYKLRFDVEEMVHEWLVSGRKRGDFEAKDGATYTVPITLIALHHGELPLPKVTIAALPITGEMTMGSMAIPSTETYQVHGAEKVLVLPRGGRSTFVVAMGTDEG